MAPKSRAVTAKALQALLTRIGSASSGTKDNLQQRFTRDVTRPHLFGLRPEWQLRQSLPAKSKGKGLRIISIDMGIKNLAYCDVEVDYMDGNTMHPTMEIRRWDKLNLVDATQELHRYWPNQQPFNQATPGVDDEVDPYSLSVLSQTAYWFVQKPVLEASPDIILIERQRWRSASSSAIQQWTVRVNTLEAMLWSVLETIRTERKVATTRLRDTYKKRDYEIYGVDPKRVGHYWLGQHAKAVAEKQDEVLPALKFDGTGQIVEGRATEHKTPRSKAEKKAKIAILRSWLSTEPASTAPSTPDSAPTISFRIGEGAIKAQKALSLPSPTRSRKKKGNVSGSDDDIKVTDDNDVKEQYIKKLDDITDCCLQAAAWVAWESNRLQLFEIWDKKRGVDGVLPALDEDTLKEMIEVAGER
jgi:cruciform cutting endonuclease 1